MGPAPYKVRCLLKTKVQGAEGSVVRAASCSCTVWVSGSQAPVTADVRDLTSLSPLPQFKKQRGHLSHLKERQVHFLLWRNSLEMFPWEAGSMVSLATHACGLVQVPGALQTGRTASMAVITVLGVETGPMAVRGALTPGLTLVHPSPTLQCYRTYGPVLP